MNDKELLDLHDRYNNRIADLSLGINSADLLYLTHNRPFDVGAILNGEFHVGANLCNGDWLVTYMYPTIASDIYRHWPHVPQLKIGLQYMQNGRPDNSTPAITATFLKVDDRWEPGMWTLATGQHTWIQASQHYIIKE